MFDLNWDKEILTINNLTNNIKYIKIPYWQRYGIYDSGLVLPDGIIINKNYVNNIKIERDFNSLCYILSGSKHWTLHMILLSLIFKIQNIILDDLKDYTQTFFDNDNIHGDSLNNLMLNLNNKDSIRFEFNGIIFDPHNVDFNKIEKYNILNKSKICIFTNLQLFLYLSWNWPISYSS